MPIYMHGTLHGRISQHTLINSYIGEDYIYEKPHHDYWGDLQFIHNVDPNNPGYGTYWWWENGMKVHVEIGHNLQDGSDSGIWISDNNYNVTIWYRG